MLEPQKPFSFRTRPIKKVRIICNDPDATDSSDDEGVSEKKVKQIIHEINFPIQKCKRVSKSLELDNSVQDSNNGEKKTTSKKRALPMKEINPNPVTGKYRGVRQRKWGKWAAEIRDPFQQKRVWLGTYNSAEEASKAYESKRLEFEALANSMEFSSEKSSNNNDRTVCSKNLKQKNDVARCASVDSSGSIASLVSHASPASVLEVESHTLGMNSKCKDEKNISGFGGMDEELMVLAQIGEELDLDMDPHTLEGGDYFALSLDDIVNGFDDLPICGFDDFDQPIGLPNFDLDLDLEACNEALAWMNDSPTLMNEASLNIACS